METVYTLEPLIIWNLCSEYFKKEADVQYLYFHLYYNTYTINQTFINKTGNVLARQSVLTIYCRHAPRISQPTNRKTCRRCRTTL